MNKTISLIALNFFHYLQLQSLNLWTSRLTNSMRLKTHRSYSLESKVSTYNDSDYVVEDTMMSKHSSSWSVHQNLVPERVFAVVSSTDTFFYIHRPSQTSSLLSRRLQTSHQLLRPYPMYLRIINRSHRASNPKVLLRITRVTRDLSTPNSYRVHLIFPSFAHWNSKVGSNDCQGKSDLSGLSSR